MNYPVTLHHESQPLNSLIELMDRPADTRPTKGRITTEHAASSNGLPVLVADGQALGTAECPEISIHREDDDHSADVLVALGAAEAAGYRIRNAAELRAHLS